MTIIPGDKRKYTGLLDDVFLSKLMYNDNGAEGVNKITVSVMVGILALSLFTTGSPDTRDMERFFQASKCQVPSFSTNSHPSVQNRSILQLIYHLRAAAARVVGEILRKRCEDILVDLANCLHMQVERNVYAFLCPGLKKRPCPTTYPAACAGPSEGPAVCY